jgi:uncharacterized protein YgiM (DUF1202 family)
MTIKHWMLLGALMAGGLLATSTVAQDTTPVPADPPPPPLIPAPAPAPSVEAKPATKPVKPTARPATRTAATTVRRPSADLKPGPAMATEKNVNVRGQAAINSEIVTRLKRGDTITVLEQVTLKKSSPDEPGKWAKILLPTGSTVWTHAGFIDPTTKAVKPNRLNLRSGPGENYSILGRIDRGTVVHEIERKGEWIKIEAPTNAYAFAAAHLFTQEPAQMAAARAQAAPSTTTAATRTAPTPTPPPVVRERPVDTVAVSPPPTIVTPPPTSPAPAPATTTTTPPPTIPPAPTETVSTPVTIPEPPPAAPETTSPPPIPAGELEPLVKRIVTREGIVRGSASIQAPTYLVLRSLDNNKTINYLHSLDTNIVLRSFQHQRVIVVGEEILDERWPNTPVIDVESIEAVP